MIEVSFDADEKVITVRTVGAVTDADWEAALPRLDEAFGPQANVRLAGQDRDAVRLLMDWEDLEGWQKGARSTCTWFCMGHQDMVGRVAILGDRRWLDDEPRIADLYKAASVRFFEPSERSEALAWLSGRQEARE